MAGWLPAFASLWLLLGTDRGAVLHLPFRSQLDGAPYQAANCGPTAVAMTLAYNGIEASLWDVRVRAMRAQGSWTDSEGGYSDDYGVFVQHLAAVAEGYGLRTAGLWRREGGGKLDRLRDWQPADVRHAVLTGQPVIVQVRFQALPGREELRGFVDHYIVVHGLDGEDFVYSDPYDRAGGGPRQVIGASALRRAMQTASTPGAAFAVYAPPSPQR